jgi:hypothetical protein
MIKKYGMVELYTLSGERVIHENKNINIVTNAQLSQLNLYKT